MLRADFGILFVFFFGYLIYSVFKQVQDAILSIKKKEQGTGKGRVPEITDEKIKEAMTNKTFGSFTLTPAVIFFKDGDLIPREGYKVNKLKLPNGSTHYQMIVSASAEKILDVFDDFLSLLGDTCGIVLEDFRNHDYDHIDYYAYNKDTVIIRSTLLDFEELLLNDGLLGVAIYSESSRTEIQLTKHKIIQVFASELGYFRRILSRYSIREDSELKFLFEDFYLLVSCETGDQAMEALKDRLCIDNRVFHPGGFEATYN